MYKKLLYWILQHCKAISFKRKPKFHAHPTTEEQQDQPSTAPPRERTHANTTKNDIHKAVKQFLFNTYDFRYNVLTDQVEFRELTAPTTEPYQLINRRLLNTLVIESREAGINCWDKDVERLLKSNYVDNYHPFYAYMSQLPKWDGKDRILPLAQRVDDTPIWTNGFRRWLLALTAQWMGMHHRCANTLTPLLISQRQGMSKSTFCRLLMPPELREYYIDKFDLNAKANVEMKLAQFGLINLDEFDRYSNTAMATLKNLVQLKTLSVKKSYATYYLQLGRIASFIGTSNQTELLNDPTGSRRFLCIEVKHPIDCSPIDYPQLYAQLKTMVEQGERVWMNSEEETALQEHNLYFKRLRPDEEVFFHLYQFPTESDPGILQGAAEIHRHLCKGNPSAMRGINVMQLGRTLSSLGLKRVKTKTGNKYWVIPKKEKEIA